MAEHINEILTAFSGILLMFIAIIGWIGRRQINRIDCIEREQKEIKENYLDRFDRMHEKLDAIHTIVVELHTEHKIMIKNKNCL